MTSPGELKILSSYLLVPAQLPTIISLQEFTELFPAKLQSSPHIRTLYRDLQSQRNAIVDSVAVEIEDQVQQGKAARRIIAKTRRANEGQEYDEEVEIERLVSFLYGLLIFFVLLLIRHLSFKSYLDPSPTPRTKSTTYSQSFLN